MKVILTHEVSGLGTAGDVVDVKDGYARNFLFRRDLATAWTKGGQKQVDSIAKGREVREVKSLEEAKSIKGNLESKPVTVPAHAGKEGRLFGAVSSADIAAAVKAAIGTDLDKRKIEKLVLSLRSSKSTNTEFWKRFAPRRTTSSATPSGGATQSFAVSTCSLVQG